MTKNLKLIRKNDLVRVINPTSPYTKDATYKVFSVDEKSESAAVGVVGPTDHVHLCGYLSFEEVEKVHKI